jgi:hypothetical protein
VLPGKRGRLPLDLEAQLPAAWFGWKITNN